MNKVMADLFCRLRNKMSSTIRGINKQDAEISFWITELQNYMKWYSGESGELYGVKPPNEWDKVKAKSLKDSAILTWFNLHQKPKYLHDLGLPPDAFNGERVLDIGSGPFPSALSFEGCTLYCLDPLHHKYLEAGFPMHYYDNVRFLHAFSEDIPIEDGFFDAVISVNAIDHVDNLLRTSNEISRVLKVGGKLAMHVHYHKPTVSEPLEIDDQIFRESFSWCTGLVKVGESKRKFGYELISPDENYALWKNFTPKKTITAG